ncbi:hypothetical protein ACJJTC_005042 [Scirpophaga incertulas]
MDNMASNVSMRNSKQRKENLITRKQDKSPEKTIRGTRGAYRGIPSTSKRSEEEDATTGSTERLDRPKKFISPKSNYGLGKRPDFSLKNRNVHLTSSRYGQCKINAKDINDPLIVKIQLKSWSQVEQLPLSLQEAGLDFGSIKLDPYLCRPNLPAYR